MLEKLNKYHTEPYFDVWSDSWCINEDVGTDFPYHHYFDSKEEADEWLTTQNQDSTQK